MGKDRVRPILHIRIGFIHINTQTLLYKASVFYKSAALPMIVLLSLRHRQSGRKEGVLMI